MRFEAIWDFKLKNSFILRRFRTIIRKIFKFRLIFGTFMWFISPYWVFIWQKIFSLKQTFLNKWIGKIALPENNRKNTFHFISFIFARFIKNFIFSINISLKISLWRFGNSTLMNDDCLFKIDLKILFSLIEKSLIFNSPLFENLIKTFSQVLFCMKNNDLPSWRYICNKQKIINFNNCFYLQKD